MQCKTCGNSLTDSTSKIITQLGFSKPQYCHICSWQRKMAWQNEYTLFKRACSATGKQLVAQYPDTVAFPVYERTYWNSDSWEIPAISYDPERSFLLQHEELSKLVPRPHNQQVNAENSEYTNLCFNSANCYLSFQIFESEDLLYCYRANKLRDSMNCFFCSDSELLYECANVHKSYNLQYSRDSENCRDSAWLFDCKNVQDSFMCWNLRNKQFCWLNEQLTENEYQRRLKELDFTNLETIHALQKKFQTLSNQCISKQQHTINTTDSDGDYLVNCHNCNECYFTDDSENSNYVVRGTQMRETYDSVVGGLVENCYNVLQPGWLNTAAFIISCNHSNNIFFSEYVNNCSDVIGCISIRNKKFCILNTQYSETEYRRYQSHIIEELAASAEDFFNPALSPYNYRDTIAQLYFPDEITAAHEHGFIVQPEADSLAHDQLADNHCRTCGKAYVITAQENALFKKMEATHCTECFKCRITRLAKPYSQVTQQSITCSNCQSEIKTVGSNLNTSKIFCTNCYNTTLA